ncbi:hypothetical protein EI94DRAFT_1705813 [Lactarius quietus]|nr:hypothetical protein EI94DRAFT_1705813 [Lactarius quietus]
MDSGNSSDNSHGELELPSGPAMHAQASIFKVTPEDANILNENIVEFQEGNTVARNTLLERAMGELYNLCPAETPFDKRDIKQKLRRWFYNHSDAPHRQAIRFIQKWSARNVFYHAQKDDIMKLAQDVSEGAPGSQAFLGALQDATTQFWNELSIGEIEMYEEIVREWSENGPPDHIQLRQNGLCSNLTSDSSGLSNPIVSKSIVLIAYAKEDGTPQVAMDEWNNDLDGGVDFDTFYPNWRNTEVWDQWKKYSRYCFGTEEDRNAMNDQAKTIKTTIDIITDEDEEPEVPSVTEASGYQTKVVQAALRKYCIAHMRFISGKKKAYIPWAKVTKDPNAWIYEECYPPGFQWAHPSKIQVNEVFHLFDHWRQQKQSRFDPIIWNPSLHSSNNCEPRRNSGEEEDFGPAMAGAAEDDMEPQYSVSPPVSSIPSKRTLSAPGSMESEEDVPDADIPSSSSSDSNPDIPSPILSHNEPLDSGGPSTLSPQIGQGTAEHNVTHEDCLQNPPSVDVPKGNAPYVRRSTRDIKLTQKARLRNLAPIIWGFIKVWRWRGPKRQVISVDVTQATQDDLEHYRLAQDENDPNLQHDHDLKDEGADTHSNAFTRLGEASNTPLIPPVPPRGVRTILLGFNTHAKHQPRVSWSARYLAGRSSKQTAIHTVCHIFCQQVSLVIKKKDIHSAAYLRQSPFIKSEGSDLSKNYQNLKVTNIPITEDHELAQQDLIVCGVLDWAGMLSDSFGTNEHPDLLSTIQELWDQCLSESAKDVHENPAIKKVKAVMIVGDYIKNDTILRRDLGKVAAIVCTLLPFPTEQPHTFPLIYSNVKAPITFGYPLGALALSTAVVKFLNLKCALTLFKTGVNVQEYRGVKP